MIDSESKIVFTLEENRPPSRARETFFASIILHLCLILLVVTHPHLFEPSREEADRQKSIQPKDVTILYEPALPRPRKLKTPPKSPVTTEAARKAEPSPKTESKLQAPKPQPQPRPAQQPPKGNDQQSSSDNKELAKQTAPPPLPKPPEQIKETPKPIASLEQVPKAEQPAGTALKTLPLTQVGPATDSILKGLAQQDASGRLPKSIQAPPMEGGPSEMKLNIPGPQILSDTMGVDFSPYLLRILTIVRRNWSTVIPEIGRLGRPGRVVVEFTIQKNGRMPDLTLTGGSGTESLDAAALSSIRLSNPFPPLPPEFPGGEVRLRFLFLYNMKGN